MRVCASGERMEWTLQERLKSASLYVPSCRVSTLYTLMLMSSHILTQDASDTERERRTDRQTRKRNESRRRVSKSMYTIGSPRAVGR